MKNLIKRSLLVACLAGASSTALLASAQPGLMGGKVYVTATGGISSVGGAPAEANSPVTFDTLDSRTDNEGAGRLAVGYQRLLSSGYTVGLEAGLGYYGKLRYTETGDTDDYLHYAFMGFDAAGVVGIPLTKLISATGKVGMAYIRNKLYDNGDGGVGSVSNSTWDTLPELGLGLTFKVNREVSIISEYTHIAGSAFSEFSTADSQQVPRLNTFFVGVKWIFG